MQYYEKLRILRQEKHISQAKIAEYLETDRSLISDYERGKHQMPIYHLIRLADLYNVSLDWICSRTTKREVNY